MFRPQRLVLLTLATVVLFSAACGGDNGGRATNTRAKTTATSAAADHDVLAVAAADPELSTFLAALDASGIMRTFHGPGPFTLFIPTNDAFRAALGEMGVSQDKVFADRNHLADILKYHVVDMSEREQQVMAMSGQEFTTENGAKLAVSVAGNTAKVGSAMIVKPDVVASNGVVHVIDKLLVPPAK